MWRARLAVAELQQGVTKFRQERAPALRATRVSAPRPPPRRPAGLEANRLEHMTKAWPQSQPARPFCISATVPEAFASPASRKIEGGPRAALALHHKDGGTGLGGLFFQKRTAEHR